MEKGKKGSVKVPSSLVKPQGKAESLSLLRDEGFAVPPFFLIRGDSRQDDLTACQETFLKSSLRYAVRSSASIEDSDDTAMAGLFQTFLDVAAEDVPERVRQCFASGGSDRVQSFLKTTGIEWNGGMTVIVQQMVTGDVSGILFTVNPQGILSEMTAVLGYGAGDGVVEDKVPVSTYIHSFQDDVDIFSKEVGSPVISEEMVRALKDAGTRLKANWPGPVDAEFSFEKERLWLLQARPVTTLDTSKIAILDSSNISESYPGLTLPLSIDFAKAAYSGIFQGLLGKILGERAGKELKDILKAMVASSSGRMYYRIDHWYQVMKLLPLSKRYIPVWQEMMGVTHRSIPDGGISLGVLTRMAGIFRFAKAFGKTHRDMDRLDQDFTAYRKHFQSILAGNPALAELEGLYFNMRDTLLRQWDVTLLNDVHAFVFTGILKKLMSGDPSVKAEEILSRIGEVESMKPMLQLKRIARNAPEEFLKLDSEEEIRSWLETEGPFQKIIRAYLDTWGDRYLEELKLESRTFRTDTILLQEWIQRFREEGRLVTDSNEKPVAEASKDQTLEDLLPGPSAGEEVLQKELKGLKGWTYRRAVRAIRYRESSRLNRTRAFGMARELFLEAGAIHAARGDLEEARDVFWLDLEEVFKMEGGSFARNIARRKALYEEFSRLPVLTRLVFAGEPFDRTLSDASYRSAGDLLLLGKGASPGIVRGRVLKVETPEDAGSEPGRILVTRQTDPGWVFLISGAKGLIAENGSFLSHTAIISRELGKPAVVGLKGAMTLFSDGELVEIDGATGEVRRLDPDGNF